MGTVRDKVNWENCRGPYENQGKIPVLLTTSLLSSISHSVDVGVSSSDEVSGSTDSDTVYI